MYYPTQNVAELPRYEVEFSGPFPSVDDTMHKMIGFNVFELKGSLRTLSKKEEDKVKGQKKGLFHFLGPHIEIVPLQTKKIIQQGTLKYDPKGNEHPAVYDTAREMIKCSDLFDSSTTNETFQTLMASIPSHIKENSEYSLTKCNIERFIVLGTFDGAHNQGMHIDAVDDGTLIFASADGKPFRIGLVPYSMLLILRIQNIRKIWLEEGGARTPEDADPEVCAMVFNLST